MPVLGGGKNSVSMRKNDSDSGVRVLALFVVLSLVLFTFSVREGDGGGPFSVARSVANTIAFPARFIGAQIARPFGGLGNIFANLTASQETLSDLKSQNESLQAQNAQLEEEAQQAQRLQALLALKSTYNLQSVAVNVIAGATDSWSRTITIDKGSSDGLAVGMPVTDTMGAIGQIIEVSAKTSVVRLITDEQSGVSAMIQSNRAQGILKGSADGRLYLTLIGTDQTVNVGDMVITSGLGGVYPKGLPIGKVTNVNKTNGALYYDIEVEPLSSSENYEELLVITSLTDDQMASSEDIATADAQDAATVQTTDTDESANSDNTSATSSTDNSQE